MIKVNELRVGNKIKWIKTAHTVENIYSPDMDFKLGSIQTDIMDAQRGLEEYDPIPLTPEILEKAGFLRHVYKYADGSKAEGFAKGSYLIRKSTIHDGYGMEWFPYKQSQNIIPIEFFYLHQLQNYFSLTGEELEINL